jgi:hypothetical protein
MQRRNHAADLTNRLAAANQSWQFTISLEGPEILVNAWGNLAEWNTMYLVCQLA